MAETRSKKDPAVFDVSKPGKAAASATSKPVIVTNRPIMADPMVVDDADKPTDEALISAPSASKKKIEPLHQPEAASSEKDEPAAEEKADEIPADKSGPNTDISSSVETPGSDDKSDVEQSKQQLKAVSENAKEIAERKEAERLANLEKVAAAKTYYLPINQVERRRNKRAAALGLLLIIVLGVAWADIALDAGLITIPGVKPVTHLFSK